MLVFFTKIVKSDSTLEYNFEFSNMSGFNVT